MSTFKGLDKMTAMAWIVCGYASLVVGFAGFAINVKHRQIGAGLFLLFAGAVAALSCSMLATLSARGL